jgi:large subunit ribosomal protein L3
MIQALIGVKKMQTQRFLSDGTRIPVTEISLPQNPVISLKTAQKDGYTAVQLGLGTKKHPTKQLIGHIKGANVTNAPHFLREVRVAEEEMPQVGDIVKAADVFKPGDIIDVIGVSKGKGYAGGVKRYHFKGGPRTHGQSDRERAPGSIGQTTTPGRVYKGKRMAGHMGVERVTVKNLEIVAVLDDALWIKGLVPGGKNNLIYIKKVGEDKKFVPLLDEPKIEEVPAETPAPEQGEAVQAPTVEATPTETLIESKPEVVETAAAESETVKEETENA